MNRVVITGMGAVTPLGNDLAALREGLLCGRSGIRSLSLFPAEDLPTRIAGECQLDMTEYKDRKIAFALAAARSAIDDAHRWGRPIDEIHPPSRRGLSIGIGLELFDMGDMIRFSRNGYAIPETEAGRLDFLQTPSDFCVSLLAGHFDLKHPPAIHVSACAAGNDAIGHAFLGIRRGEATMVLTGGTDSMINPLGVAGFCRLNALSRRNDAPEKASRPFDRDRDGFVLGEGAGMLVLEDYDHALRRRARVLAEVVGYGNSFDAFSVSEPHPEGRGALLAMTRAIRSAAIAPERIDYINAHGTSTPKNDSIETLAIKKLFGPGAARIPISSTKSMIGHLISAAGAVEAVASILCSNAGKVHPTINLDNPDVDCDLDYVAHASRDHKIEFFMSNAFAFGGQNASIVFRNMEE